MSDTETTSILTSVKKMLGINEDYTHFDSDIVMHINTVFSILTQLGVGPSDGFTIDDSTTLWTDFIDSDDLPRYNAVKSYVYLRVKQLFDPSLTSSVSEMMNQQIAELEWRLYIEGDADRIESEENQNE